MGVRRDAGHAIMMAETPWCAGRLGSRNGLPQVLFGRMHEDAEIERAAFQGKRRVFCIASSGCTALRLCGEHEVTACDLNPAQLAYAEQRLRGRAAVVGEAERAMNFARVFLPFVGWRASVIRAFLALSDGSQQIAFWRAHLDTRRFRTSFDALMSRATLRMVYAPRFLSFLPPKFGSVLRARLERGFTRHANATNPHARALLLGESDAEQSTQVSGVQFVLADAASYLESCAAGCFDAFALSNILDGTEPSYRHRLSRAVRHAAGEDAVVVWRSFGEPSGELHTNYAELDRAMLWGIVDVGSAHDF